MRQPALRTSAAIGMSRCIAPASAYARMRLLDDSVGTGVWPDSVKVSGGQLSMRLPTRSLVWLTVGLHPAGHRDEAWLQKGLSCS